MERFVHFWALVIRQFTRHRCFVRASALSYSTLIALIPLLAVALSVTSSLLKTQDVEKFQHVVERVVASITPPNGKSARPLETNSPPPVLTTNSVLIETNSTEIQTNLTAAAVTSPTPVVTPDAQKEIARQIWSFVQNTQSGTLGATGVVLLIFVAISLLGRIEETFNDIWGVTRGRNWLNQVQLYSTTIILGPLLLLAALGLASSANFESARLFITQMPVVGKFIFSLLPLLVLWLAFTFIYQLLPNTKVNFSAAFLGAAVAGTLWHLNNIFGYLYVSRVITNSQMYGKLGLVPVFMIGIYFSWVFLLFGAQIAYAFQNRAAYLQDRLADNINQRGREFVALRIMTCLGQRFQNGARPASVLQLSQELGIPSRLTQSVLRTLAHMQLVTETTGAETAFVPARPLEKINAYDILLAMRTGNGQELPVREDAVLTGIYGEFARIEKAERETASAISMLALVQRTPVLAAIAAPKVISTEESADAPKEKQFPDLPLEKEPVAPVEEIKVEEKKRPEQIARRETVRPGDDVDFPL